MVENKTVLYAAIFIIVVLAIIYMIFVVYNVNKLKQDEVVNDSTLDSVFWMGVVLIVAFALILIWLIAVFFMGDSAVVAVADVVVDASDGSTIKTVEMTRQTVTPVSTTVASPVVTQRVVTPASPVTTFTPATTVTSPVSVTSNSIQQSTLDAVLAASGSNTYNPV